MAKTSVIMDTNLMSERGQLHRVCKHFLCGFCPTELFTNTRADLGVCDKLHDEALKKGYEKSSRFGRVGYEEDFVRHLQSLLADVERRIKRGHARLALNNTQGMLNQQPVGVNASQEQIEILTSRINELVEEAEQLGCEGKVEEAQGVMKLCEQLREEREQLTANRRGVMDEDNIKRMEVCQVCGALLVSGDAQQRIDEHMSGKQHVGYARIREYIEHHKKDGRKSGKTSPEPEDREAKIVAEREEREKMREKEREERKKQEEKERERSRDREERRRRRRSRSRSRHRSRSRDKSRRSRSRERKKSRDRDRDRRSRHKSRSRSRSRRSSREKSRRSRSRDRKSRRHREEDESRKSSERNGEGHTERMEAEKPRNPPEPPTEPPRDDPDYTAGDTN